MRAPISGESHPAVHIHHAVISQKRAVYNFLLDQTLPVRDSVGSSDPYAKVYLLQPNGSALFQKGHEQTKTFKNKLNLNFEDEFLFTVRSSLNLL